MRFRRTPRYGTCPAAGITTKPSGWAIQNEVTLTFRVVGVSLHGPISGFSQWDSELPPTFRFHQKCHHKGTGYCFLPPTSVFLSHCWALYSFLLTPSELGCWVGVGRRPGCPSVMGVGDVSSFALLRIKGKNAISGGGPVHSSRLIDETPLAVDPRWDESWKEEEQAHPFDSAFWKRSSRPRGYQDNRRFTPTALSQGRGQAFRSSC